MPENSIEARVRYQVSKNRELECNNSIDDDDDGTVDCDDEDCQQEGTCED